MASSWLDSWGASWGDAWGQQATNPNAMRGISAGSGNASATLTAIAWTAGSAAGTSSVQGYLELDGGRVVSCYPYFMNQHRGRRVAA